MSYAKIGAGLIVTGGTLVLMLARLAIVLGASS